MDYDLFTVDTNNTHETVTHRTNANIPAYRTNCGPIILSPVQYNKMNND